MTTCVYTTVQEGMGSLLWRISHLQKLLMPSLWYICLRITQYDYQIKAHSSMPLVARSWMQERALGFGESRPDAVCCIPVDSWVAGTVLNLHPSHDNLQHVSTHHWQTLEWPGAVLMIQLKEGCNVTVSTISHAARRRLMLAGNERGDRR